MTLEHFITTLKSLVVYDKEKDKHIMGSTVLTNQELNHMLIVVIGDDYTKLNGTQRTKIRQRVFKEIT